MYNDKHLFRVLDLNVPDYNNNANLRLQSLGRNTENSKENLKNFSCESSKLLEKCWKAQFLNGFLHFVFVY